MVNRLTFGMKPPRISYTHLAPTLLVIFLIAACSAQTGRRATLEPGAYQVDTLFQRYHDKLGGLDTLGPAISPVFENQGLIYQYTSNVLMVFDPQRKGSKISLAPLGRDMRIFEFPESGQAEASQYRVDGYTIYDKFVPLYERLGGREVAGKVLTEAHLNVEEGRIEQYFENLGFYWFEGSPAEDVYLLAYGAWKCDRVCRHDTEEGSRVNWPSQTAKPFVEAVARWGLRFTGYALTPPYLAPDGHLEQVYQNVVLETDLSEPDQVQLVSVPDKVGIPRDVLMPANLLPNFTFYPVQGDLGYNIPLVFLEYLQERGGMELAGSPITQALQLEDNLVRQCFEKLCLEGQVSLDGVMDIQPVALGIKYLSLYYNIQAPVSGGDDYADLTIQIWEAYPMVSPEQEQEIVVSLFSNNAPAAGIAPELELYLPSGQESYVLPLSDEKGESHWAIDPVDAENGTLVPYKVCVQSTGGQRFCIRDSYLIWETALITVTPEAPEGYSSYLPFVIKNFTIYVPAVVDQFVTYFPLILRGQ